MNGTSLNDLLVDALTEIDAARDPAASPAEVAAATRLARALVASALLLVSGEARRDPTPGSLRERFPGLARVSDAFPLALLRPPEDQEGGRS